MFNIDWFRLFLSCFTAYLFLNLGVMVFIKAVKREDYLEKLEGVFISACCFSLSTYIFLIINKLL